MGYSSDGWTPTFNAGSGRFDSWRTTNQGLQITGKMVDMSYQLCLSSDDHIHGRVCHAVGLVSFVFTCELEYDTKFPHRRAWRSWVIYSIDYDLYESSLGKTAWGAVTGVAAWTWTGTVGTNKAGLTSSFSSYNACVIKITQEKTQTKPQLSNLKSLMW